MVLRKRLLALLFAVALLSCTSVELDNPCDRRNGIPSQDCYLPSVGGGSSSSGGGDNHFNPNIPYINFIDNRDGKTYKSVVIGTQTWMAENLNYRTPGGASRCYPTSGSTNWDDNDNANCDTYGRLYDWATAMNNSASSTAVPSGIQGVCPDGWHLPSRAEWEVMTDYIGGVSAEGKMLKATSGWKDGGNGEDTYGFSALPGGRAYSNGSFVDVGGSGYWWSATDTYSGVAQSRYMSYNFEDARWGNYNKEYLSSVRCVRDSD